MPKERRELAEIWIKKCGLSERRSSFLVSMSRSQLKYKSQKKEDPELLRAILEIKEKRPQYGLPRVLNQLRRRGFLVNGKKVYRLLKTLQLQVPRKRKRRRPFVLPTRNFLGATMINEAWAMDFVFDRLSDGSAFRCFTIIDILSREVPGIFVSKSMAGFSPIKFLEKLKATRTLPKHFILDNGTEFANDSFIKWCGDNDVSLHFIDPGKPVQNAYIESFNGKFRLEFLNSRKFKSIGEAQTQAAEWVDYYNNERPHSSLDYLTPKEFAVKETSVLDQKINSLVLKTG